MTRKANASFVEKLAGAVARNDSLLCVGLDPDPARFPDHFPGPVEQRADALLAWGQSIIAQTADLVCCYKPNFAFYEQFGPPGLEALRQTIAAVPDGIPVLLDAKRGDIGSTATAYARAAFEIWGADAITVSPYLGRDGVAPFLAYAGKMAFVLCYTSNPSAWEVQEFGAGAARAPLFEHVVRQGQSWGDETELGFVVGATRPQALARLRQLTPGRTFWVLAPGVGAQGGDLAATLAAGLDGDGRGLILPVSRAVIYAPDPRAAALALRDEINRARREARQQAPPAGSRYTDLILDLHELGCIQFGQFTLASGQQSPIYLDLRRLTASPSLTRKVAQAYADLLRPFEFEHLAAVPYAALTIGMAVALTADASLLYPRKEVKAYGTGRAVEGVFSAGERAVIVEDLVTSGSSVLKAAATLEAAGLIVSEVVVLIDREQGARAALAERGYRLHPAVTLSEILETLHQAGRISAEQMAAVKKYLALK